MDGRIVGLNTTYLKIITPYIVISKSNIDYIVNNANSIAYIELEPISDHGISSLLSSRLLT
jgi:hypothetical protein